MWQLQFAAVTSGFVQLLCTGGVSDATADSGEPLHQQLLSGLFSPGDISIVTVLREEIAWPANAVQGFI